MTNFAKNQVIFYNQDGQVMYRKENIPVEDIKKEITKLYQQKLKWVAFVVDYNIKKQYSIYYDADGVLQHNRA